MRPLRRSDYMRHGRARERRTKETFSLLVAVCFLLGCSSGTDGSDAPATDTVAEADAGAVAHDGGVVYYLT